MLSKGVQPAASRAVGEEVAEASAEEVAVEAPRESTWPLGELRPLVLGETLVKRRLQGHGK